jgi:hypothetical protein
MRSAWAGGHGVAGAQGADDAGQVGQIADFEIDQISVERVFALGHFEVDHVGVVVGKMPAISASVPGRL